MPKMTQKELESHQAEIQAWLDKGNKITICEPGARTEDIKTNMYIIFFIKFVFCILQFFDILKLNLHPQYYLKLFLF